MNFSCTKLGVVCALFVAGTMFGATAYANATSLSADAAGTSGDSAGSYAKYAACVRDYALRNIESGETASDIATAGQASCVGKENLWEVTQEDKDIVSKLERFAHAEAVGAVVERREREALFPAQSPTGVDPARPYRQPSDWVWMTIAFLFGGVVGAFVSAAVFTRERSAWRNASLSATRDDGANGHDSIAATPAAEPLTPDANGPGVALDSYAEFVHADCNAMWYRHMLQALQTGLAELGVYFASHKPAGEVELSEWEMASLARRVARVRVHDVRPLAADDEISRIVDDHIADGWAHKALADMFVSLSRSGLYLHAWTWRVEPLSETDIEGDVPALGSVTISSISPAIGSFPEITHVAYAYSGDLTEQEILHAIREVDDAAAESNDTFHMETRTGGYALVDAYSKLRVGQVIAVRGTQYCTP